MSAVSSSDKSSCCWPFFDNDSDSDEELDAQIMARSKSAHMTRKCPQTGISAIVEIAPGVYVTRDYLREQRSQSGTMASEKQFGKAYAVARREMEANNPFAAPAAAPSIPPRIIVVVAQQPPQQPLSAAGKK